MNKTRCFIAIAVIFFSQASVLHAQITELPYLQDFETDFTQSVKGCTKLDCATQILPGWSANEVQSSSRIYHDSLANTGRGAAGCIPISSFSPELVVSLNLSSYTFLSLQFYASGYKNGGDKDTRPSKLYIAVSADGGNSFAEELEVDSFLNEKVKKYRPYHFMFPDLAGKSDVRIRFRVVRSASGAGQAAKVLLDDVAFRSDPIAGLEVFAGETLLRLEYKRDGLFHFNKSVTGEVFDLSGKLVKELRQSKDLDASLLPNGIYLLKTDQGECLKLLL